MLEVPKHETLHPHLTILIKQPIRLKSSFIFVGFVENGEAYILLIQSSSAGSRRRTPHSRIKDTFPAVDPSRSQTGNVTKSEKCVVFLYFSVVPFKMAAFTN